MKSNNNTCLHADAGQPLPLIPLALALLEDDVEVVEELPRGREDGVELALGAADRRGGVGAGLRLPQTLFFFRSHAELEDPRIGVGRPGLRRRGRRRRRDALRKFRDLPPQVADLLVLGVANKGLLVLFR